MVTFSNGQRRTGDDALSSDDRPHRQEPYSLAVRAPLADL